MSDQACSYQPQVIRKIVESFQGGAATAILIEKLSHVNSAEWHLKQDECDWILINCSLLFETCSK